MTVCLHLFGVILCLRERKRLLLLMRTRSTHDTTGQVGGAIAGRSCIGVLLVGAPVWVGDQTH